MRLITRDYGKRGGVVRMVWEGVVRMVWEEGRSGENGVGGGEEHLGGRGDEGGRCGKGDEGGSGVGREMREAAVWEGR